MIMRIRAGLALMLLGLVPAFGGDNPILGHWIIVKAELAPWVADPQAISALPGAKLVGLEIAFEEKRIVSTDTTLGCTDVTYEQSDFPPDMIFQGGLAEPENDAAKAAERARNLGLPEGNLKGVEVGCSTGLFSYHFTGPDMLVFAFDNYIYTLARTPPEGAH